MTRLNRKTQDELLARSAQSGINLGELLESEHLGYDDLRYNDCFEVHEPSRTYHPELDAVEVPDILIPAVSFFSGAGGLNVGFKYAGFDNIISIEHVRQFCDTLRLNDPDKIVIGPPLHDGDLRDRDVICNVLEDNDVTHGFNGVFHGGPPCQSFSVAANQRFSRADENFKRRGFEDEDKGRLIFDYLYYIRHFFPLGFLIENVAGIEDFGEEGLLDRELETLREMGYNIPPPVVMDAADYGVPQHRKRWIVMGSRGHAPLVYPPAQQEMVACGPVLDMTTDGVENHQTRRHKAESVARYVRLAPGSRDKLGRVDRLDPLRPSKTIIAGGVKGGGRSHLHPYVPRTISVRECARLQTFPDNYVFTGSTARQFTQVGNAVPPLLAYRLAMSLREAIMGDFILPG